MNRQSEADILKRMAMNVGEYFGSSNPGELLSGFLAMIGNGYNGELLVYGRAVNGWGDTHQPAAALAAEANATAFAEAALEDAGRENGECPMLWVTELEGPALNADGTQRYNTRRSAFWRTAKALVGRLGLADTSGHLWPSSIAWSNLYKIAPALEGNPSNPLCSAQFDRCAELITTEISRLVPKRIVMATGIGWAEPFLRKIGVHITQGSDSRYVEGSGEMTTSGGRGCRIVIAPHPQGKPTIEWVEAVARHLNA